MTAAPEPFVIAVPDAVLNDVQQRLAWKTSARCIVDCAERTDCG